MNDNIEAESSLPRKSSVEPEGPGKQVSKPLVSKEHLAQEIEVQLPGKKVSVTPISASEDGSEAVVKVSIPKAKEEAEPQEERSENAAMGLLVLAAALGAVLLLSSRRPAAPPPS